MKESQILVTTLLALVVIAIVSVTLVLITTRDIRQVANTEKYNQTYYSAETKLFDFIGKYSNKSTSNILQNEGSACSQTGSNEYTCSYLNDQNLSDFSIDHVLSIKDRRDFTDFELGKDVPLEIYLGNYLGNLDFRWDKDNVAIEFNLIYRTSTGEVRQINDVYDFSGTFDSFVGFNPYNSNPTRPHPLNFISLSPGIPNNRGTRINTNNITGIAGTDNLISLRIIPRMKELYGSIRLSMTPESSTLPLQIREYKIRSYQSNDPISPEINLIAQIPVTPQIGSVFDYALISPDNIQ